MENIISCEESVPWVNTTYFLERQNMNSGQLSFDTIDESGTCDFEDRGLMNDTTFCYRIRTLGRYGIGDNTDSLTNLSQIICGSPIDSVGPCPPVAMAQNPCSDFSGADELNIFCIEITVCKRQIVTWEKAGSSNGDHLRKINAI